MNMTLDTREATDLWLYERVRGWLFIIPSLCSLSIESTLGVLLVVDSKRRNSKRVPEQYVPSKSTFRTAIVEGWLSSQNQSSRARLSEGCVARYHDKTIITNTPSTASSIRMRQYFPRSLSFAKCRSRACMPLIPASVRETSSSISEIR